MNKLYNVAGHVFQVVMPSGHGLWNCMQNYSEFQVLQGTPLFTLTVTDQPYSEPEDKPIFQENPERPDMPRVTVYRGPQWWAFSMRATSGSPQAFLLRTTPDFSQATLSLRPGNEFHVFALNNSLMLLYTMNTTALDTLAMHASVVMKDGKGYMFLGTSGTGKSTHSRMWLENIPGTELLNDDNPVLRILPDADGKPMAMVYGSPWSGKTPCYKNKQVPVGAIIQIRRCSHNELVRQNIVEAYAALLMSCSGLKFREESVDQLSATQNKLLASVPFYFMDCLPNADAARVCYTDLPILSLGLACLAEKVQNSKGCRRC